MFADEKGYLVTEMVWEEVSGDEGEDEPAATRQPVKAQQAVKPKPAPAAKKAAAPASKDGGAAKPQQKSMMSFFGKK
jgi:hypothetical protein